MILSDLRNWPIFHSLESSFIPTIRMAIAYGDMGSEALIATKDKMVYGIANINNSFFKSGEIDERTLSPRKVDALCGKSIKTFACGETTILALTEEGEVYLCMHNKRTLADKCFLQYFTFQLIETMSTKKDVIHVACGSSYFLALTDKGDVYAWDEKSLKQKLCDDKIIIKTPRIVGFRNKKIVHISCGYAFSVIVTDNGEVYSWGDNRCGPLGLGLGNSDKLSDPCRITHLSKVVIEKTVCGDRHVLALSSKGTLYTWGYIGNDITENLPKELIVPKMGRVFDIAASCHSSISVAMGEANRIFIWGECLSQYIDSPILTSLKCLHDAFACYSIERVMHQPLILNDEEETSVMDSMKEAFDDASTSDFTIQLHGELIYVHKVVLKLRSQYFRTMFQEHGKGNSQSVIEHKRYSYDVYKCYLKYLYTDEVDLSPEDVLELLHLADAYCERLLKKRCIQMIINGITVENVALSYSASIKCNAKKLEDYCFKFALFHMTEVVQTESFADLDKSVMKAFIIKAAKAGAFARQP